VCRSAKDEGSLAVRDGIGKDRQGIREIFCKCRWMWRQIWKMKAWEVGSGFDFEADSESRSTQDVNIKNDGFVVAVEDSEVGQQRCKLPGEDKEIRVDIGSADSIRTNSRLERVKSMELGARMVAGSI